MGSQSVAVLVIKKSDWIINYQGDRNRAASRREAQNALKFSELL
jgi:hypothetical protein